MVSPVFMRCRLMYSDYLNKVARCRSRHLSVGEQRNTEEKDVIYATIECRRTMCPLLMSSLSQRSLRTERRDWLSKDQLSTIEDYFDEQISDRWLFMVSSMFVDADFNFLFIAADVSWGSNLRIARLLVRLIKMRNAYERSRNLSS